MESSASVPQQKPSTLDGIDIEECFKQTFCLNILVCGRTGVGKSSLINNLVGREVCQVNDPGIAGGDLDRGTTTVSETKLNIDNVFLTIFDSPGLQDGTDDEERYLQEMYDKCKGVNLVLYCMEMTSSRYTPAEVKATELITNKFGPEFWKRAVLVMTKANMVRVPPEQKGKERNYHKHLYDNFVEKFSDQLIKQRVNAEIAHMVPGVAAGNICEEERYIWYPSNKAQPSEQPVDFLSELWMTCFDRTATESQAKFLRATTRQRKKPLLVASEAEETLKKEIEEAKRREEEVKKKYTAQYQEQERKYARQIEEVKHKRPVSIPHVYNSCTSSYSTPRQPSPVNTGRAAAGAMTGAAAGAMVAGPVGALVGGFFGFLFGK